jgi:hypothetical protein
MSLLHRLFLPTLAVAGLGFLVACSSSNSSTPPPSGGFSNSDLNGTYTFSVLGGDTNGELSIAGAITACGCSSGQISAGTVDITDSAAASGPVSIISSGSGYTVNADGTGTFKLGFSTSSGNIQYQFAFALTDAAHGVISEYDDNGTGSGTIDLQPNPVTLSNSSYAFSLSGATNETVDGEEEPLPLGGVGAFTLGSSGVAGTADFNLDGTVYSGASLTGSISAGSGTTPGSATFSSTGFATQKFDVYAIDATHLKLIENDGNAVFVGDLFSQPSATISSGSLSFTMSGFDGSGNPLAVGGTFASDGNLNFSSGAEAINDNGNVTTSTSAFTGTFVAQPSGTTYGRFLVDMTGFTGGTDFAAYPSSGGLLMLEIDSSALGAGVSEGVAMTQNSPAGIVASQGYALNLTGGIVGGGELDQIAQFNTGSSKLSSGTVYFNNSGTPNNYGLSGSSNYTSSQVVLSFNGNSVGALYFGVDSATSLALGIDTSDVSLGVVEQQGTPSSTADVASRHLAMIKAAVRARAAKSKKKQQ